jgi:dihydroorotate dehydrogenase
MLFPPFYDPEKSYEDNFHNGPFNAFTDSTSYQLSGEPQYSFFGHPVYLPFGIPAGPLVNGKFVKASLQKGFDLPMYKTVRTRTYSCHPLPNVVPVAVEGDLTIEKADQGLTRAADYTEPIAITNSFGVPSFDPDFWQPDLADCVKHEGKGQVVIGSFQGTNRGEGVDAFIDDHVLAARLMKETGVKVTELNLSCPNEGTKNLLCFDKDRVLTIVTRIKEEIGNLPLLIKLAYFQDDAFLRDYVSEIGKVVDGFSTINTIQAAVYNPDGSQALPGEGRLRSGICGAPIKWAGIDMVKRLHALRNELGYTYQIVGVGGVTKPEDYTEYMQAGADAVMSATGAMWNPFLAQQIKEHVLPAV